VSLSFPVGRSVILLAGLLAVGAHAMPWQSVQGQSQLEFIATFEGAEAPGRFRKFAVAMSFDPPGVAGASLRVDVDIASAEMGNADMDEAIAEPQWFNAPAFPRAVFSSDKIRAVGESDYVAEGTVSIKGVERPVNVPFHWRAQGQTAEMTGSLTLSRQDFGIGNGEWQADTSIGHPVQVRFRVILEVGE
jgi:polyisoprenoid-binding protein YceI